MCVSVGGKRAVGRPGSRTAAKRKVSELVFRTLKTTKRETGGPRRPALCTRTHTLMDDPDTDQENTASAARAAGPPPPRAVLVPRVASTPAPATSALKATLAPGGASLLASTPRRAGIGGATPGAAQVRERGRRMRARAMRAHTLPHRVPRHVCRLCQRAQRQIERGLCGRWRQERGAWRVWKGGRGRLRQPTHASQPTHTPQTPAAARYTGRPAWTIDLDALLAAPGRPAAPRGARGGTRGRAARRPRVRRRLVGLPGARGGGRAGQGRASVAAA